MAEIDETPEASEPALSAPVPLTPDHDLSAFDCGEPALNDWLRHRALKNESRFSRTYVVCENNRVVAYFCISAGSVEREAVPGKIRRNAPDRIPVSVIGRLAVSLDHAGKGLGADVLSDALRRIASASRIALRRVHRISAGQPHAVPAHRNGGRDFRLGSGRKPISQPPVPYERMILLEQRSCRDFGLFRRREIEALSSCWPGTFLVRNCDEN
jgi:hypothetical protein